MTDKSRRDENAEATRKAIIESGLELFAEKGYQRTSLDEVAERARVTKGAVYYHFQSKREVFEAVFSMVSSSSISQLMARMSDDSDPRSATIQNLLYSYFDICVGRIYYRIVLQEGPVALGWGLWRDFVQASIEEPMLEMVKNFTRDPVAAAISDELLLRILTSAIHELALTVVDNPNRSEATKEARLVISELAASFGLGQESSGLGRD